MYYRATRSQRTHLITIHWCVELALPVWIIILQWGFEYRTSLVQWGSKIQPFETLKHLKPGLCRVRFQMVWFSNGWALAIALAIVPTVRKPDHSKSDIFVQISNVFWQNGGCFTEFQMVGLPDYRPHSKSIPFETQPLLDRSKSRLIWISATHCIKFLKSL